MKKRGRPSHTWTAEQRAKHGATQRVTAARRREQCIAEAYAESCARCGYTKQGHALVNFADGPLIGAPVLICPFATWKEREK